MPNRDCSAQRREFPAASGQAQSVDRIIPRRIRTPEGATTETKGNVRFGSKADIARCQADVRLPPKADID